MKPCAQVGRVARSPMGRLGITTLAGQLILAGTLPIAARLYGAYAVGVFAALLTLGQMGAILATGRLEQALPRLALGRRPIVVRLIVGLATIGSLIIGPTIALYGSGATYTVVAATTFLVFSLCIYGVANMHLLSRGDFNGVARLRVVNAVGSAAFQLVGGVLAPSAGVLLGTYALGNFLAALVALMGTDPFGGGDRVSMADVSREESLPWFAATVGGSAFLTSFTLGLPVLALTYLYGEEVAASYFLVRRLLGVPTQLVSSTVNEVSYALMVKMSNVEISTYVTRWLRRLLVGAGAIVAIACVGALPMEWVLGEGYVAVGLIALIQAPAAAAQLLSTSLSNVLLVLRAEHVRLFVNIVRCAALAGAVVVVGASGVGYVGGVAILSLVTVLGLVGMLWATLHLVGRLDTAV